MAEKIIAEDCIKNYRKPVFIAGDLNDRHRENAIAVFKGVGFEVYENYVKEAGADVICGLQKGIRYNVISSGESTTPEPSWFQGENKLSDHKPFVVKVKSN